MPKLIPDDGDKIVLISPDGIEYPGTIEKRDTLIDCQELYKMAFKLNTRLDSSHLWPGWRIRLEDEDRSFTDFGAFLTTDRSGIGKQGSTKMKKPTKLFFFPGGNTAVCDDENQIPELQTSWFLLYVEFLQGKGVKVEELNEIWLPNGKRAEYDVEYHSWRIC